MVAAGGEDMEEAARMWQMPHLQKMPDNRKPQRRAASAAEGEKARKQVLSGRLQSEIEHLFHSVDIVEGQSFKIYSFNILNIFSVAA